MTLRILPVPPGAEAYLALDKEAGRAVHGPGGLLEEARETIGKELSLVHRLDRITSGLLLLARSDAALRAAHSAWPERVTKTYHALVRGVPAASEGMIDLPLPAAPTAAVLALGPERGWAAADRATLRAAGCTLVHLGPRVLRLETACVAATAILKARLGWLGAP